MKKFFGKLLVSMALVGGIGAVQLTTTGCSSKNKKACEEYIKQMCTNENSNQCKFVKGKIDELGGPTSDRAIDFCERSMKK